MNRYKKQQGLPVTLTLLFLMILTFILQKANPQMFIKYFALQTNFENFYPWQFVTYIFLENVSGFTFFFKALIVFMFSSSLETEWTSGKLSIFLVLTVLPKSIIAAIFARYIPAFPLEAILNGSDSLFSPNSLFLSLMIAYGFLHREEVIYLFFIIPIKIWILAAISIGFAAIGILGTLAKMTMPINIILTAIQLSGYLGIIIFSRQIFFLASANRRIFRAHMREMIARRHRRPVDKALAAKRFVALKKRLEARESETAQEAQKALEEILQTFEKETKTTNDNGPLCDPIDFDESDSYCKDCEKFKRCLERKQTAK